jgi:hypothetical protein
MPSSEKRVRPGAADVARRLLILRAVVAKAQATPPLGMLQALRAKWSDDEEAKFVNTSTAIRDELCRRLTAAGLWEYLSPSELEFVKASTLEVTQQQHVNASWRIESFNVLMWALGFIGEIAPYDVGAKKEILKQIEAKPQELIAAAKLRSEPQIDRARNIAELWHWRSRTRQLIESGKPFPTSPQLQAKGFSSYDDIVRDAAGMAAADGMIPECIDSDFPVNGKAYRQLSEKEWSKVKSITMERHLALNWLCGYAQGNRWDETPTGT